MKNQTKPSFIQNWKKVSGFLIAITLLLLSSKVSYASHAMGADLSYTCLGGNMYEFTLAFYRDCDGISQPTNPSITISSASCSQTTTLGLVQVSGMEVSSICNAQLSNSTCNGGTLQGVQQYTYTGTYTLPANCTDWVFSYSVCCRNGAITNSDNPQNYDLYVEATLNNVVAPCNSSPYFTTPPVPYICAGQLYNYNHGAVDIDGDTLIYTLIDPLDGPGASVPYLGGFSAGYPISTTPPNNVIFDNQSGQMTLTPSGPQIGIVTVLIQEYRNGVLIGTTMRDMQVVVLSGCSNAVPDVIPPMPADVVGGVLDGSSFQVCAGQTLSFSITASDPDPADILNVISNVATSLPGATVTTIGTNPVIIQFSWPTTSSDVGVHSFTLTVSDDACPTPGEQILGYDILVPGVQIVANDTTVCPAGIQLIQLDASPVGGTGAGTFTWTPAAGLSNPNIANPVATIQGPASYTVTYDDGVCVVSDVVDIVVDGVLNTTPAVSTICEGSSVQLNADFQFTVPPPPPACGLNTSGCNGPTSNYSLGTGTTATGPGPTSGEAGTPFLGYYEDGRTQILYRASDLAAEGITAGLLTQLAFNIATVNSTAPYDNFTIRMGCTEDMALSGAFVNGTVPVYTGSVSTIAGWNTFAFQTPFEWNGISNLIVEVCFDNLDYTRYDHVFYTPTVYTSVLYRRVDGDSGCNLSALTGTVNRPNIRLVGCSAIPITPPVTYTWTPVTGLDDPTIAMPTATPAVTTSYTVLVDNGDCLFTETVIVNVEPFTLTTVDDNIGCLASTGTLGATIVGGVAPYSYTWSNGSTGANPTGIPPGSYTVTVTDVSGCSNTGTASVIGGPNLLFDITPTDPQCNGTSDGSMVVNMTSGTAPYSYNWTNGIGNTGTPTNLGPGSYDVTVTDATGCSGTGSATLVEPAAMTNTVVAADVICFGEATGSLTSTVVGGTAPFSYVWDNGGGTNQNPAGLVAGVYNVVITDANGCTTNGTGTISQPASGMTASAVSANVSCNSLLDGSITLTVNQGVPPYTFAWDNGAGNTQSPTNLGANTYTVLVTDDTGCTATASATVQEPDALAVSTSVQSLLCFGDTDGSISVTVVGGTAPFIYVWDNGAGSVQSPTNLTAGTYNLSVTDANNCIVTTSATITEPTVLTSSATGEMVNCFGGTDGDITLTVAGGTPPYTYNWDNGGGTVQNPTGLGGGVFNVVVTDDNGCTTAASASITAPASGIIASSVGSGTLACNADSNGSIDLTVVGGTPPYIYTWTNGASVEDPTGLGANNYSVLITDSQGCTATSAATISEPPAMSMSTNNGVVTCFGNANGGVSVTVAGGTAPYTFQWDNGGGTQQSPTGLGAGTYNVTVTDLMGCTLVSSASITEPPLLSANAIGDALSCFGDVDGGITLNTTGGTAPYNYNWSNGAGSGPSPSGLTAGMYDVTITDSNGCVTTASATITEPVAALSVTTTDFDLICNGDQNGIISGNAIGGTPPYSFAWTNGAGTGPNPSGLGANVYSLVVTDANGCTAGAFSTVTEPAAVQVTATGSAINCSNGNDGTASVSVAGGLAPYTYAWTNGAGTGPNPTGLGVGTYGVLVTDANGCTGSASVSVTSPNAVVATIQGETLPCFGDASGDIQMTVVGGVPPYSYVWNNGAGTSQDPSGLSSGTYAVSITDSNGCTFQTSASIIDPPPVVASIINPTDASCFNSNDGSAGVDVAGGTPPYYIEWDNNQVTTTTNNLSPGFHSVSVVDSQGCSVVASTMINAPTALSISTTGSNLTCFQSADGSATVSVDINSSPPYNYQWSNGEVTTNANGLNSGISYVTVTDSQGCSQVASIVLTEPTEISLAVATQGVSCNGIGDGSASVVATGGAGGYTYAWSNGQGGTTTGALATGVYTVTVTDASGCFIVEDFYIDNAPPLSVDGISSTPVSCFNGNDGSTTVVVSDGVPPYTFIWSDGQVTQTAMGLPAGSYQVTVVDANGCTSLPEAVSVVQPNTQLEASLDSEDPSCNDGVNGSASITVQGGTPGYSIAWNTGQSGTNLNGLGAGSYTATVTDANGCEIVESVSINEPTQVSSLVDPTNTSCNGSENGVINITNPQGGSGPYFYSMDGIDFQPGPTFIGLTAGDYMVYVQDVNGCQFEEMVTIEEPIELTADAGDDIRIKFGDFVELTSGINVPAGSLIFEWSPPTGLSCIDCPNPNASPEFQTTYTVNVSNGNGCEVSDDVTVFVEKDRDVFIPTAFTPNQDSNNDVFMVHGGGDAERVTKFRVFDRWGEVVFEQRDFPLNDPTYGWDGTFKGKRMNAGVFAYTAEVIYTDGETFLYHGDVTLLR